MMIRYLPLVVGGLGGVALLANRMVTANLTNSQSRADALGGFVERGFDFGRSTVATSSAKTS